MILGIFDKQVSISFLELTSIIVAILFSTLASILFTQLIRKYSVKIKFYERVEERRVEQKIVRIGGIAIVLSFYLTIYLSSIIFPDINDLSIAPCNIIIISAFGYFLIGIIDDLIYLSPWIRLIFQFIIAIFAFANGLQIGTIDISSFGLGIDQIIIPYQLNLIISVVFLVGMTNAINWLDGLDGLAAGVVAIICSGITLILLLSDNTSFLLLSTSIFGTCVGFLFLNFYPAKIYMGDGGSNFLGFLLAAMTISITGLGIKANNLLGVSFLNFIPILDMIVVIVERYSAGYSIFYPDKRHLHHKLLRRGLTQKQSVLTLYASAIVIVSITIYTYTI